MHVPNVSAPAPAPDPVPAPAPTLTTTSAPATSLSSSLVPKPAPSPMPASPSRPSPPVPSSKFVTLIPSAMIVNYIMRDKRKCPGGHVAKSKCAHRHSPLSTMDHAENQSTRLSPITAHRNNRQICNQHLRRATKTRPMFQRERRRRMRESSAILWAGGHITDALAPVLQEIDNVMNAKCVYT